MAIIAHYQIDSKRQGEKKMDNLDKLVKDELVPMRKKIMASFSQKHPQLFSMVNAMMAGRDGKVGMQVTENGQVVGKYTFQLDGINIVNVESGTLESALQCPLVGILKPYATIERSALEEMLKNEQNFIEDPFPTIIKYLPKITISFMQ